MRKTVVWCVGNPILQDDGAGPELYRRLSGTPVAGLVAVDCGVTPENHVAPLAKLIREYAGEPLLLIVVDAADMGLPGGSIRRISPGDLADVPLGAHGIPLDLVLSPLLPDMELVIIGIQPARRGLGDSLSPEVADAVSRLASVIREGRWDEIEPCRPYQENCSPR